MNPNVFEGYYDTTLFFLAITAIAALIGWCTAWYKIGLNEQLERHVKALEEALNPTEDDDDKLKAVEKRIEALEKK